MASFVSFEWVVVNISAHYRRTKCCVNVIKFLMNRTNYHQFKYLKYISIWLYLRTANFILIGSVLVEL